MGGWAERQAPVRDAAEALDYLEGHQAGRGQAFLDRLNEVLARIGVMPESTTTASRCSP
jgi:hypothetical protein